MPQVLPFVGAGASALGALSGIFGGGNQVQTQPSTPPDLQGMRGNNIGLMNYLLFGGQPGGGQGAMPTQGNQRGARGGGYFGLNGPQTNAMGPAAPAGGPSFDPSSLNANNTFARFQNIFGQMGTPTSPLQRQTLDAIGKYLNQPAPEQQALNTALPSLQNILGGKPGQGIMDALTPMFQRNLAMANQQGGRFGTANAVLKSRALEDYNLLGAQAAQVLNMLSQSAGQNPFNRQLAGYGVGQQQAQQDASAQQQFIDLYTKLLGQSQGASIGGPVIAQPSSAENWAQTGNALMQIAPFMQMFSGGGGGGVPSAGAPNGWDLSSFFQNIPGSVS